MFFLKGISTYGPHPTSAGYYALKLIALEATACQSAGQHCGRNFLVKMRPIYHHGTTSVAK